MPRPACYVIIVLLLALIGTVLYVNYGVRQFFRFEPVAAGLLYDRETNAFCFQGAPGDWLCSRIYPAAGQENPYHLAPLH